MELNFGKEKWYTDTQISKALDSRAERIINSKDPTVLPKPSNIELSFLDFLKQNFAIFVGKKITIIPTNKYSTKVSGILEKIDHKSAAGFVLSFKSSNPVKYPHNQLLGLDDFKWKVLVILDDDWDQPEIQKKTKTTSQDSKESV